MKKIKPCWAVINRLLCSFVITFGAFSVIGWLKIKS